PNFHEPFDITTDASGTLCHYRSHKKWRQYLLGRRFRVFTDHHSLKHLLTQTIQTPEQHKWLTKLLGYDFELHYKPGKENKVAHALSRPEPATVLALSTPTATWLNDLRSYYQSNPEGKSFLEQLEHQSPSNSSHTIHNGLVYNQGRLFIPNIPQLRFLILKEFHNSTLGGHGGIGATIRRLASSFYWPYLKKDVKEFVKKCTTCQSIKYPTHKPYGLLQPLPIPSKPWHDVTMDFITHLPPSHGKTAIWVIVDRLSKFAHFISLPTHYTSHTLATIFL
nr:transposon Ty3-G Gag-Pol polyprotein [Tanacetum cinerariifolium]